MKFKILETNNGALERFTNAALQNKDCALIKGGKDNTCHEVSCESAYTVTYCLREYQVSCGSTYEKYGLIVAGGGIPSNPPIIHDEMKG